MNDGKLRTHYKNITKETLQQDTNTVRYCTEEEQKMDFRERGL